MRVYKPKIKLLNWFEPVYQKLNQKRAKVSRKEFDKIVNKVRACEFSLDSLYCNTFKFYYENFQQLTACDLKLKLKMY